MVKHSRVRMTAMALNLPDIVSVLGQVNTDCFLVKSKMFYLSSLPPNAQQLGKAIRQHWSIENQLHWVLDVTFGEDACRIRTGNAPENIALLKRWSINLLNQETSFKRSTRQKARRACMDEGYLLKVLASLIPLQSNASMV